MVIAVPLGKLLRSVVLAPEAPPWFVEVIKGITAKYEIPVPVHRSKLIGSPI